MRLTVIGLVFILAVSTLVWVGYLAGSVPHYDVATLTGSRYTGEECRMSNIKVVSIENEFQPLRFTVQEPAGGAVTVEYRRSRPDNFKIGSNVALKGFYHSGKRVFEANDVTTACPSKYEGEAGKDGYGKPAPSIDLEMLTPKPQQ